jgi:hypothetical protein
MRSGSRIRITIQANTASSHAWWSFISNQERVIAVSFDDRPLNPVSKKDSHLTRMGPILHRAFSVFLFDEQGRWVGRV